MTPDELTPIWGPDGESILTFAAKYTTSPILPQGRVVLTPDPGSTPDPADPSDTMIAFRVKPEVASQYGIGPSAAAQANAEVLPLDERHITLVYTGQQDALERKRMHDYVRRWLAKSDWPSLEGKPQGWGTFTPGGDKKPVLWMSWDIPGLQEMRADLLDGLKEEGFEFDEEHDFLPHETVAYMPDGDIKELPPFPENPPTQEFNAVVVAEDDLWTEYPMPMNMGLIHGSTMSLTAALEAAVEGLEGYTDEELDALIAAGGVDRNRGNAERLRRYWTVGPGGAKIKWNTPGDWRRCVVHLSKHLGPRAKGYCALRHKEMTRLWTGDMKHRIMYGWGGKPGSYWAKVAAQSLVDEHNNVLVATSGEPMPEENPILMMLQGQKPAPVAFEIPMLLPEGIESGDGRTFKEGVTEVRELPIPLLWQPNSMQGHDGAAIVGRIDDVQRIEGGLGNAKGVFDSSPLAQEAVRLIKDGFLRGVSADLDRFEAKVKGKGPGTSEAEKKQSDDETITPDKMDITKGRVMAATLVAKPAFQECVIKLLENAAPPDGDYVQEVSPEEQEIRTALAQLLQKEAAASFAITASAGFKVAPIYPPKDWFENPGLTHKTHLSITDDGRVYGHIAAWDVNHIGMNFGVRPPKSRSGYAYFRTGLLRTQEGTDVRVGQLTLAGGHASLDADVRAAVRHYDDTASAWADVAAGEDRFGIWVAGALRPTVTAEQVRAARASSPSGDWRPINGVLELVAVCSVNVPGFPVVEARVAGGQVLALVAAGVAPLYGDELASLDPYVAATLARERMYAPLQAQALQLSAKMLKLRMSRVAEFKDYSTEQRKNMEKSGHAMPGGGYPIKTVQDLKNAIHAYGRAKESERAKVRKHIMKRARALGHPELIPDGWSKLAVLEFMIYDSMAAATTPMTGDPIVAAVRKFRGSSQFDESKHARDAVGRFRKIYYRLRHSPDAAKPEIKAALKALKDAERITKEQGLTDADSAKTARDALDEAGASKGLDERTQVEIIQAAEDMADIMHRIEVRGPDTMISFDQLPAEIQDVMKKYMQQSGLEERISKHFGPLVEGETSRSVKDILNFLERIIIDKQSYRRGYDTERV